MTPLEVECKFRIENRELLEAKIREYGGEFLHEEKHRDTYLRHPSRDFRTTDEALRIREVNGNPLVTYKGPRQAGPVKIRPEIEIPLVKETVESWLSIWKHLGFEVVAQVSKVRLVHQVTCNNRQLTVTIDSVEEVGEYAEIERVVEDSSELEHAQNDILALAVSLGLGQIEKRSYLILLLSKAVCP